MAEIEDPARRYAETLDHAIALEYREYERIINHAISNHAISLQLALAEMNARLGVQADVGLLEFEQRANAALNGSRDD